MADQLTELDDLSTQVIERPSQSLAPYNQIDIPLFSPVDVDG